MDEAIRSTYEQDSRDWDITYVADLHCSFLVGVPSFHLKMFQKAVGSTSEANIIKFLIQRNPQVFHATTLLGVKLVVYEEGRAKLTLAVTPELFYHFCKMKRLLGLRYNFLMI